MLIANLITGIVLIAAVLVAGYSCLRLFGPDERQLSLLRASEAIYLIAISGIALASWLGLILAELGIFSLWLQIAMLWLASAAATIQSSRGNTTARRLYHPRAILANLDLLHDIIPVLALVALGIFLFFKPFEFIFGGWDAGVYVNTGVNIAQTGSISMQDTLVSSLGPERGWAFFERVPQPWYQSVKTLGFYIRDFTSGEVVPQFFHVYPVWIAILTAIGGVKLGIFATPLFALLGILGVFLFARRVFSLPVALLASFFLSLSAAQIWFARFPMAETVVQTFLFSGLFAYALMLDVTEKTSQPGETRRSGLANYLGLLAGASLGLVHLTKVEMIFIAPVVVLLLGYQWINRRFDSAHRHFAIAYFVLLAHSAIHAVTISAPYTFDTFAMILGNLRVALAMLGLGLVFLLAIALLRTHVARVVAFLLLFQKPVALMLIAVVAFAAGYAYFIRPDTPTPEQFVTTNGLLFRTFKEENFVRFGWYVSPIGLLLGVVGFSQVASQGAKRKTFLFMATAFLFTATFAWSGFVYSSHFWAARRLVPIVIPALLILAACAIVGSRTSPWTWSKAMLPIGLSTLVVIPLVQGVGPVLPHVEYEGATERVTELAKMLPANSIVLFEQSDTGVMLSTPLDILYGRKSAVLPKSNSSNPQLGEIFQGWLKQGKRVYWASGTGDSEPAARDFTLAPVANFELNLSEFERPLHKFPSRATVVDLLLDIYEVVPGVERAIFVKADPPENDFRWKGFYPAQMEGADSFRWSQSNAEISVPMAGIGKDSYVVLRIGGGRPRGWERGEVAIYINDLLARKTTLPENFKSFAIPLTTEMAAGSGQDLRVRIEPSIVYNLKDVSENNESRPVGVKVAWVAVKSVESINLRQ